MQLSYWSVKGGEQQAGMGAPAGLRNEAQPGFFIARIFQQSLLLSSAIAP